MKARTLALVAALVFSWAANPAISQTVKNGVDHAEGDWLGSLNTGPGASLHLAFHFKGAGAGLTGSMDSLDQGAKGLVLEHIDAGEGQLTFEVPQIGGRFKGAWVEATKSYAGEWMQGSVKLPLSLVHGQASAASRVQGLDGMWDGALDVGGIEKLRLVVSFSTDASGTVGKLRSIDQGQATVALTSIERNGRSVKFAVASIGASFEGELATDDNTLTGQFTQGGRPLPLQLVRRANGAPEPSAYKRPQLPKPPFPYRSVEVGYDNPIGRNHLAGTLTLPPGPGPFAAALLITGSGLQDRDETLLGHKPFLVLADYLTRRGVAVLRVDDRTMGGSTGDVAHATSADFATDVEAGVAFLKTRPEIDHKKIGLIGHSEGGMIAPMVAIKDPGVAWIVLMAGPGLPGDVLLLEQGRLIRLANGQTPEAVAKANAVSAKVIEAVKASKSAAEAHDKGKAILIAAGMPDASAETAIQTTASDWFRYFFNYDPAPTLAKVRQPILAIDGSLDLQVPPKQDLAAIKAATQANPDVTAIEIPGLNHLFQTAKTGSPSEYQAIEETLSPIALKIMGDWILAHTR